MKASLNSGWTFLNQTGKCYKYFSCVLSWSDALEFCHSVISNPTSTLASVPNKVINDFLVTLIDTQVWTGGHLNNGSWAWTDGSSWEFTNWAKGEPSKKEDFIELVFIPPELDWAWKSGQWNNLKGLRKIPYVCQYDFLSDV